MIFTVEDGFIKVLVNLVQHRLSMSSFSLVQSGACFLLQFVASSFRQSSESKTCVSLSDGQYLPDWRLPSSLQPSKDTLWQGCKIFTSGLPLLDFLPSIPLHVFEVGHYFVDSACLKTQVFERLYSILLYKGRVQLVKLHNQFATRLFANIFHWNSGWINMDAYFWYCYQGNRI